jgi:class 3 adenylate cyclase
VAVATLNEHLLDEKLAALEAARAWSPRVISKLETVIRTSDDDTLFRINPIRYAADKGLSQDEGIDLFLHGTKIGLFEMEWHLVCPYCGHIYESFRQLNEMHNHFTCNLCSAQHEVSLDDFIQVAFTISPQIRVIRFHDPAGLPVEDLFLRYYQSQGVVPGEEQSLTDVLPVLSKMMDYLEPGERRRVDMELWSGVLQVMSANNHGRLSVFVRDDLESDGNAVFLRLAEGRAHAVDPTQTTQTNVRTELAAGRATVELENISPDRTPVWLLHLPGKMSPPILQFEPFLSGKQLLTTQTFRELFRTEVIRSDEGIGVKDITFLFTDLKGSTALYDQIGDPKAFYLVRQHFDTLSRVIAENHGAVVKTIGDAVMATFTTPSDATRAAVAMLEDIATFNRGISQDLILKIGIHRGHSIVVTLNDRLDYFGQTVNIAARVQALADADEIYISEDAFKYPGVADVIEDYQITPEEVSVKGVRERLRVYRVRA